MSISPRILVIDGYIKAARDELEADGALTVLGGSGGDVVVAVHGPGDLNSVDWKLCAATLIHNT